MRHMNILRSDEFPRAGNPMDFQLPQHASPFRRRKRWLSVISISAFSAILLLIAFVSAWNYFDISFNVPSPTSALNESRSQAATLAAPPSGETEWSFNIGEPIAASPVAHGGLAFIVAGRRSDTGRIIALDMASGMPRWTYTLSGVSDFPPAIAGDLLYTVVRDGRIVALDRRSGQEKWTYMTGDLLLGTPVVRDGALFAASDGIHALDALTGELLWIHETERGRTITPLAYSEGIIAVLSEGNHLNLIDAMKGKRRLTARLWFGGADAPVISDDAVVVSGDRGSIQTVRLHARDIPLEKALRFWWGKLWLYKSAPRPPDPVGFSWHNRGIGGLSARTVADGDGRLFLVARYPDHSAEIVAVDASDGDALWQFQSQTIVAEGVTLAGDTLVAGTQAGEVYGLDAETGEITWQVAMGFGVSAITVAPGDALLAASTAGVVHRFR